MTRNAADVLRKARETLGAAEQGLRDLDEALPPRRINGIRNVAVFGRAVTNVLQTLRDVDRNKFNQWYEPFEAQMQKDPLMRYFYKLRTEILKEGGPDTPKATGVIGDRFHSGVLMSNPPPGAFEWVLDGWGAAWLVRLPDGSIERYLIEVPEGMIKRSELRMPNPPTQHLGQPVADTTVQGLCKLYVHYLSRLVDSAEEEFSK
jgi:hypothetical protein